MPPCDANDLRRSPATPASTAFRPFRGLPTKLGHSGNASSNYPLHTATHPTLRCTAPGGGDTITRRTAPGNPACRRPTSDPDSFRTCPFGRHDQASDAYTQCINS
ncbi:hypothetical protein B296_00010586 [Ensete ventricosum]|uniref:Uncharacterized protein n=1 Tax=Ensete ventricosum TaxID=4639 RepID=A0A427A320_ENSVE|nr:hypothetical protein B296_00010586 [Ensete ventricosum]